MKKSTMRWLWIVLILAEQATGCFGTSGRDFDTTHARDIRLGMPKGLIWQWFGRPRTMVTMTPTERGCVERWIYSSAEVDGTTTTARALVVDFDSYGMVCSTAYAVRGD